MYRQHTCIPYNNTTVLTFNKNKNNIQYILKVINLQRMFSCCCKVSEKFNKKELS